MKAVNLIPSDARRGGAAPQLPIGPAYLVLGLLVVALGFVTLYVLTNNTIASRKAQLAQVNAEITQAQARAQHLANYVSFEQLAQTRAQTVRQIASARFDWYGALSDLSKVVPANTSLESLSGSVAPGANAGGSSSGGSGGSLRAAISAPAFELSGCTQSQDDVARLMSRLRLIRGVTRVTLSDSQKTQSTAGSTVTSSSSTNSDTSGSGCGANGPSFDLVVFFQPLANAGPNGVVSAASQPVSTTSPPSTTAGAK